MKPDKDVLRALYGTDADDEIFQKKETEKQIRAFAGGNQGKVVITAEETRKLLKAANNATYYPGDEHRIREYVVTDETVDRYGDIVRAKGVSLVNYKKNPVVQFAHDYEQPPVGISIKTWYDKDANCIRSWALFNGADADPSGRSDLIFRLVESNRMRACSIGFMPMEVRRPKNDEERAAMGLGPMGVEFIKSDQMEFSPCPVPANPNALNSAFVKSYQEEFLKTLRSGRFTTKDVETIRKYPLFGTDALDLFIQELDARSVIPVVADVPKASAITLSIEGLVTLTEKIIELGTEIKNATESITSMQSQFKSLASTVEKLSAGADEDRLYDEVFGD